MDDKADRDRIVVEMIEEGAATGALVERPAERVADQAGTVVLRLHLPELLDADAEFLRLATGVEREALDELLGERTAHALADQRVLAEQRHAGLVVGPGFAVPADAHVTRGDADHGAGLVIEHLGRGKARIDLDPERLGPGGKPAADIAERDD